VRILLITHEASRSGAPRVALLAAKSLVDQGHQVQVISRARGPLLSEFADVAPTSVEFFSRVRRRLWRMPQLRSIAWRLDAALVVLTLVRRRPDLVYVNSTAAAIYLGPARRLVRFRVLHVHESGSLAARFLGAARAPRWPNGVALVACSPSVQADLAALTGQSADAIAMLPSVPDESEVVPLAAEPPDHTYSADELVVGTCGTVEHRKGADLWVEVAKKVSLELADRSIRFVWVGDIVQPVSQSVQNLDIEFIGPSPNPYAHMRRFDVATLPSRDDPFPLVVLEAMLVGTPVVAFAVGSVATQVGDAGIVVAPEDTDAFATGVVRLLSDDNERNRLGTAAHARVMDHYSTRAFATALADLIKDISATSER
jgi:glycosyltransferase involved in cell wall biosynthesis